MLANPIELNSRLGTYTNFVNLLDLCGLALPAAMRARRHSVRHHAAGAGRPGRAARQHRPRLPCRHQTAARRTELPQPPLPTLPPAPTPDEIAIAVVGAHLSGMALNGELKALGGRLLEATATAPDYKLYALGTTPPKPGMLRVERRHGIAIEVEVWALPAAAFGQFVAAIPPPLSIGTVRLADGRGVKGFLVEAAADRRRARHLSFGGWRAFVAERRRCDSSWRGGAMRRLEPELYMLRTLRRSSR